MGLRRSSNKKAEGCGCPSRAKQEPILRLCREYLAKNLLARLANSGPSSDPDLPEKTATLRVADALQRDVGRGIARIDPKVVQELGSLRAMSSRSLEKERRTRCAGQLTSRITERALCV